MMAGLGVPSMPDLFAALERRVARLESNTFVYGGDTGNTTLNPLTITGLDGTVEYYATPFSGDPLARINWTWSSPPAPDPDSLTADPVKDYMISVTQNGSTNLAPFLSTNGATSITTDYHRQNTTVTARVYAVSKAGRTGPLATKAVLVSSDTTPPPEPSTPTATPGLKNVVFTWDGKDVLGNDMPSDFDYCEVHMSTTGIAFTPSTSTYQGNLPAAGTAVGYANANYDPIYCRLVPVDKWGNKGTASTGAGDTPLKIIDMDLGIVLPGDTAFSDVGNLNPDGSFENDLLRQARLNDANSSPGEWDFINTAGFAAHGAYALHTGVGAATKYMRLTGVNNPQMQPAQVYANAKYYVAWKARGISANGTVQVWIQWQLDDGTTSTSFSSQPTVTGSYVLIENTFVAPSNANAAIVYLRIASQTTGDWYFDNFTMRLIMPTTLIEDAAITRAKIGSLAVGDAQIETMSAGKITTAELGAAVRVISGPESSNHAELTSTGFYAYVDDPLDGIPNEAVRMGTAGDALAIQEPASGDTLASISETGEISSQKTYSVQDPEIMGSPLLGNFADFQSPTENSSNITGHFDKLPRGVIANGQYGWTTSTQYTTRVGLIELAFLADFGRSYSVHFGGLHASVATANITTGFGINLVWPSTIGGEAVSPNFSNGVILMFSQGVVSAAGKAITFPAQGRLLRCNVTGDPSVGGELRQGINKIWIYVTGDLAAITPSTLDTLHLWVEDAGPDSPENAVFNNSTLSTPASTTTKKTYTKTYASTSAATYRGDGTKRTDTTDVVQGYNSFNGDGKGLWIFPSMTSDLSGATVKKVEVYAYANHWYYNSGGTALIKVHGYTSAPASSRPMTTAVSSSGWPKPGGRWVTLPSSLYAGFKSGTYRGFGMGPAGSTNLLYYGRFNGGTGARIRVTYVK